MDIQRVRNLTTHRLHTKMEDIYEDLEYMIGEKGIMTHQIPNAMRALDPFLKFRIGNERFWNGGHDTEHQGEINLTPLTEDEQDLFWQKYMELPSPFEIMGTKS